MHRNKMLLGMLALTFTTAAFAQDYMDCHFQIADNQVECPWIKKCQTKKLKVSKYHLLKKVIEGESLEGTIKLKKVLRVDDQDEKENRITLFDSDISELMIKKVDLVSYRIEPIHYALQRNGDTLYGTFTTDNYRFSLELTGDGQLTGILPTSRNAISYDCRRVNKADFEEGQRKQGALIEFNRAKAKKSRD